MLIRQECEVNMTILNLVFKVIVVLSAIYESIALNVTSETSKILSKPTINQVSKAYDTFVTGLICEKALNLTRIYIKLPDIGVHFTECKQKSASNSNVIECSLNCELPMVSNIKTSIKINAETIKFNENEMHINVNILRVNDSVEQFENTMSEHGDFNSMETLSSDLIDEGESIKSTEV